MIRVKFQARITEQVRPEFVFAIRDIVAQCLETALHGNLSIAEARHEPPIDPVISRSCLAVVSDASWMREPPQDDEYMRCELGTYDVLELADLERLAYLFQIVFPLASFHGHQDAKHGKYEDVIRNSVWNLAVLARLGTAPLALVGYAGLLETCFETRHGPRSRDDKISSHIGKKLNLKPRSQHCEELKQLFRDRNSVVHDLDYGVKSFSVVTMSNLARATLYDLLQTVSTAPKSRRLAEEYKSSKRRYGLSRPERSVSLAQAFKYILENSKSVY